MRNVLLGVWIAIALSCGASKTSDDKVETMKIKIAEEIKADDLKEHVYLLASDVLKGRRTGEKGQRMAVNYITAFYEHVGVQAPEKYAEYLQEIPKEFFRDNSRSASSNIMAFIEGTEKPDEIIVISAHYDHLGVGKGQVFNGADDNASGTSAVMEIAESFQLAKKQGMGPKRSILFLHFTGEEQGLFGSNYYVNHPAFPLKNTVANLNIDMIGRVDDKHKNRPEYVYLIGSKMLSTDLHKLSEATNKKYTDLKLDYSLSAPDDPNRFYYRSDHYNFAKNNVPVIFYFNGEHEDYHQTTDTADKLRYELLSKRAQLVFYTAWEIANREERLVLDEN